MAVILCEHIKSSGVRCGSPALRGGRLCYYHRGLCDALPPRGAFMDAGFVKGCSNHVMQLPLLEDAASLQMAYMQVLGAMAHDWVTVPKGRVMLSALNGASRNLARMQRQIETFGKREPKQWRGRWGYRMRGNTDSLVHHPEQHVGMRPLAPFLEEHYGPLIREGYDWLARNAEPPFEPDRKPPTPEVDAGLDERKEPESA